MGIYIGESTMLTCSIILLCVSTILFVILLLLLSFIVTQGVLLAAKMEGAHKFHRRTMAVSEVHFSLPCVLIFVIGTLVSSIFQDVDQVRAMLSAAIRSLPRMVSGPAAAILDNASRHDIRASVDSLGTTGVLLQSHVFLHHDHMDERDHRCV